MPYKGISPLIASVLLIALTMTMAMLVGPFFTDTIQNTQEITSKNTENLVRASNLDLSIEQVTYNGSSSNISIVLMNTGNAEVENLSITSTGDSARTQEYNVEIDSREIQTLDISADPKFRIDRITASLQNYPVSTKLDERFVGMKYEWYDTSDHYSDVDHPETTEEFDKFFNDSLTKVSFGGEGSWNRRIHWWTNGWDDKPNYLPNDGYSWKAEGYLYAPQTGTYTVGLDADDSTDVFIDGEKIVQWYSGHGTANNYGNNNQIELEKGWHRFKARMEEGNGGDGISVAWKKPDDSEFKIIPVKRYIRHSNSAS